MEVYILDENYTPLAPIDEAESILWRKKYNDIGECEIYIQCTEEYLSLLKRGRYVFRYDDDMVCKIEAVEIKTDAQNGDYIIATGKDICTMLSGRIVRWSVSYSGKLANYIKRLLTENAISPAQAQRAIPHFTVDESNFSALTAQVDRTAFTDDLLQAIINACKRHNYGFRLTYDISGRNLVFRLYTGKNKASADSDERVVFSPQFANIISTNYKEDESNYKNVVYVGYKDEQEATHLLSLYNGEKEPTGEKRREVYIDGTGTSRSITYEELKQMFPSVTKTSRTVDGEVNSTYYITVDGEQITVATSTGTGDQEQVTITDYTYILFIRELGENALAEYVTTQEFTGSIDTIETYEYKTDYDLGDTVKVANDYDIEAEAQITEVMESDDTESGHVVEPIFSYIS